MPRETQTRRTGDPDVQKPPLQVMAIAFAVSILAFGHDAFAAEALSPGVPAALAGQSPTPRVRTPTLHGRRTKTGADQTLAFSGVKPGVRVADCGYFTRLFSSVVGPKGHVYAVEPTHSSGSRGFPTAVAELQAYAVAHPNVTVTTAAALEELGFPEKDPPVLDFSKLPRSAVHRSSP